MKTKIAAALDMLTDMHQAQHIREEGNVKFQAACDELKAALAMPEVAPIIQPTAEQLAQIGQEADRVMVERFANLHAKLDDIKTDIAALAPAPEPAPAG